jgi:hypothetical protein
MTRVAGSPLSRAERKQRQRAALKSGAFSKREIGPLSAVLYDRLLSRFRDANGASTLKQRLLLRDIADCDARILLADEWLDSQADPLFRDRRTGELWPIVDSRDGWARVRAALIDKLPDGG